jgi:iodotyrosine deiodinase
MSQPRVVPLPGYREYSPEQMLARAREFADDLQRRRTVRDFSPRPVARAVIAEALRAATAAPSGANQQPWRFVAVSDAETKQRIRLAAEAEEREFYERRAPQQWRAALAPLGTDANKPFLETAPWLIAVFIERFGLKSDGSKEKRYYPDESVGLATGFLLAALHHAGLVALTHTPSPMKFLNEILDRPAELERPFLLLVTGYPAEHCTVPDIQRKSLGEVVDFR